MSSRCPSLVALFACAFACLISSGSCTAAPLDEAAIDKLVSETLKVWQVPGVAVAIVRDGEVVYLKGHGVREVGSKDAVTPDTVFPIASCTKAFTTTALAVLVDEGKMDWDDPVRRHVPYFHLSDPLADRAVTLRDLVCHRTGLRGHDLLWYRSTLTQEEVIRRVGLLPLDRPFRTAFQYQSTMFTTAGFAVAAASGMPWADFVQKRLLDPLEMSSTRLTTSAAAKLADRASAHRINGVGQPDTMEPYVMDVPEPAGSVYSTARDLSKWVRFHLGDGTAAGKRLVSEKNLLQTHTPQIVLRLEGDEKGLHPETLQMSYGMGWVIQDYRGQLLVSHGGAIDGFRTHLTLVPRARLGIVLLNNLDRTQMNLALSNSLVDLALGLPRKDWSRIIREQMRLQDLAVAERIRTEQANRHHGTRPARELPAYTGEYQHPAYGTCRIALDRGTLTFRWSQFGGALEHYHYDTFVVRNEAMQDPQFRFRLGTDGEVASLHVTGRLDVEFTRVRKSERD
jgi:CubicO group peptidase (beta-lactamase class C family)